MKERYIVIDTKTTGVNPQVNNILTIAILLCEEGNIKPIMKHEFNFKYHDYNVSAEFLKVNKIDLLQHYENAFDTFDDVIDFLHLAYIECEYRKPTMIGYNIDFDLRFIYQFIKDEWKQYVSHQYTDIYTIATFLNNHGIINLDDINLENLAYYFNLTNTDINFHNTLYNATKTWEIYYKITELLKGRSII